MLSLSNGCQIGIIHVPGRRASSPTLIAIHGMSGSTNSGYMQAFSHKAFREGWGAVLLNLYNLNRDLPHPHPFHAGCSSSVDEILRVACTQLSISNYFLVGVSMGGNILLKLLGEWGTQVPDSFRAAAVISPLVDLTVSWKKLDHPSNWIYRKYFISRLKQLAAKIPPQFQGLIDMGRLSQIDTIRAFDATVTAPLSGFADEMDYYRQASASPHLPSIQVPTLAIHSHSDPVLPAEPLIRPEATSNPYLVIHLTAEGGHVAFLEGVRRDIDRSWAENRVIDFFRLFG